MRNQFEDWNNAADKPKHSQRKPASIDRFEPISRQPAERIADETTETLDELLNWIAEDALFQSSQYLQETLVECDGE